MSVPDIRFCRHRCSGGRLQSYPSGLPEGLLPVRRHPAGSLGKLPLSDPGQKYLPGQLHFLHFESSSRSRRESLGEIGLEVAEDGTITLNKEKLEIAIQPEHAEKTFGRLSSFKNAIGAKADAVAINPMNYVNKVVVNYKNPGKTFTAPYFSSVYSGMMLDRYI